MHKLDWAIRLMATVYRRRPCLSTALEAKRMDSQMQKGMEMATGIAGLMRTRKKRTRFILTNRPNAITLLRAFMVSVSLRASTSLHTVCVLIHSLLIGALHRWIDRWRRDLSAHGLSINHPCCSLTLCFVSRYRIKRFNEEASLDSPGRRRLDGDARAQRLRCRRLPPKRRLLMPPGRRCACG